MKGATVKISMATTTATVCVLLQISCGRFGLTKSGSSSAAKDDGTSSTGEEALAPGEALVSAADFAVPAGFTLTTYEQAEVLDNLSKNSDVYNVQPDDGIKSPCEVQTNAATIRANRKSMILSVNGDFTNCNNSSPDKEPNWTYHDVLRKMKWYVTCDEGDFSSLNGKTMGEIDSIDLSRLCAKGAIRFEMVETARIDISKATNSYSIQYKGVNFSGGADFKDCETSTSNGVSVTNGCVSLDKSETTANIPNNPLKFYDVTKLQGKDLHSDVTSKDSIWHSSGTLDVTVGDWNGTLTYSAPKTAPTYKLTKDGTTTPITGSLSAKAALLLTHPTSQMKHGARGHVSAVLKQIGD